MSAQPDPVHGSALAAMPVEQPLGGVPGERQLAGQALVGGGGGGADVASRGGVPGYFQVLPFQCRTRVSEPLVPTAHP